MRLALTKLKPAKGFSLLLHYGLLVLLPLLVLVVVRLQSVQLLGFAVVILAKWRMFAVRPRFWPANIRANAVDLIIGLSFVIFMLRADSAVIQLLWATMYGVWLIYVKPKSSIFWISIQAGLAQFFGLTALFLAAAGSSLLILTLATGLICYLVARHFFESFDEGYARLLSYIWGYVGAGMAWLTGHWLLYYAFLAQPTLLLSVMGYAVAVLYYYDHHERLSAGLKRQLIFTVLTVVLIVLLLSDWGDKVV